MRNLSRGIFFLLLMLMAIPAVASSDPIDINSEQPPVLAQEETDEAVVRVIPNEARAGSQHIILVTGLNASESVRVEISLSGNVVYTTTSVADERGILEVEIFSETDDVPGTYTVEVFNNSDSVIGSAQFDVVETTVYTPEISITPTEAEAGSVFTIEITDAEPFLLMDVEIEDADGETIFEQEIRTNVDGAVSVEFVSDRENTGTLSLTIVADEAVIYEQAFEVLAQQLPATVEIEPVAALPGETVFITISNAPAERALRVDIVLNDAVVESLDVSSNISGLAIVPYDFAEDVERGEYEILVYDVDELIAQDTAIVDILPVETTVTPTVGTVGSIFFVSVSDLRSDETVVVDLVQDGEIIQTREVTANVDGVARAAMGQRIDLSIGMYTIDVQRLGEVVSTLQVEVAGQRPPAPQVINPEDISLTIDPLSGPVPTLYTVTVEGLPAEQSLTLFVLRGDESVFSTGATADEDGAFTTELTSEPTDIPGTYTIEIRADGNVVASGEFEISDDTATGDDETPSEDDTGTPEIEGDVTLDIQPAILRQGERVEFFIRDLEPGEVVLFELIFDDTIIYRAEPQADDNGIATVGLLARDDEPSGEYQVQITRDGTLIAANGFTIVAADATIDNAQVTVEPETGAQGTEYTITVTGLNADETVTVTVNIGDATVFEDERAANTNGTFTVTLNSDVADATGTYDVIITRDDSDALTATLEITDGEDVAVQPDTDAPTLAIDPVEGVVGTEHVVTVTGLEPSETFALTIEFDGEIVYTVERTADENGAYETIIVAAEDDAPGDYPVTIDRSSADDLTGTITVLGDDTPADGGLSLDIQPDTVSEQQPFDAIISGLEPDETVNIVIEFDGEIVFETGRSADENGEITLNLATDPGDPTGIYTIIVTRGNEVVSGDVEIVSDVAADDEDEPDEPDQPETPQPVGDVTIEVEPAEGDIGTEYDFTIAGLGSNRAFAIVVEFDGEVVFETDRTSDASGFATISLETSADDTPGTYTFSVVLDGETVASTDFEVIGTVAGMDDTQPDDTDDVDEPDETDQIDEPDTPAPADAAVYADEVEIAFTDVSTLRVVEFDGRAGDVVTIAVDSGGVFDTVATLIAPDGSEIATDDDGGSGVDPEIERIVLPETGTYTVEIRPFATGDSGTATVTVNRSDVQTLDTARVITLDRKTTSNVLVVEGEAGETLTLMVSPVDGDIGQLTISAMQGEQTLMNYQAAGLPQMLNLSFVVPESGVVVITIESDDTTTATLTVQITR